MDKVLENQVSIMIAMQDSMNTRVSDKWRENENEWYRAIWLESAEMIEHFSSCKWWKHNAPDIS